MERIARALSSPIGILIAVPAIVIGAGLVVILLARSATGDATDSMAKRQLAAQAADIQHDIEVTLDQAAPLLDRMRAIADPSITIERAGPRLHDLMIGRPGVTRLRVVMSGRELGAFVPAHAPAEIHVYEVTGATRTNYQVIAGAVRATGSEPAAAVTDVFTRKREWTRPQRSTGARAATVSCSEPVRVESGEVLGGLAIDFDIGALSKFMLRTPLPGARSAIVAGSEVVAYAPGPVEDATRDAALAALLAERERPRGLAFHDVDAHLAAIAPVGGVRGGVTEPLDWWLASVVPEASLLAPTQQLERRSVLASGGALLVAMAVSLMLAWNIVRMRRAVEAARARAREAEQRIKQLGSYRLIERLGLGGMGEVWRAEHRLLARHAAVKLVRHEVERDPLVLRKARERFRREAQTLASMTSRNTIGLYDYGVAADGTFYYVMELLDGVDLDKLVRQYGAQPAARVIALLVQACRSLAEAHDAGLLHRDIKPANIYVCRVADEVDVVKVLDFGIVHHIDDPVADPIDIVSLPPPESGLPRTTKLTQDGAVVGTPGYISPEHVTGQRSDGRSDLYSLACVGWWLLTATEVFARPDEQTAIRSHVNDPVPPLRSRVRGWLPAELEAIIIRCLAKDPQDRPADARELAESLRAIPIPPDQAWTEERAEGWWHSLQPRARPTAAPNDATGAAHVFQTDLDAVPDAPTLVPVLPADADTRRA